MLAPVLHILPLATIVRERLLPVPGDVKARLNARVTATDIVAEANWAREHVLLDVARTLGISNAAADRLLRIKVGDQLTENTLIATGSGLIPRQVRTPREGRVAAVGGGQVLLEVGEGTLQLRAGISGTVIQIVPNRGVVIQTAGALVQGLWGNGRTEMGIMENLMEKPDSVIETGQLDVSQRGSVILAGHCRDAEVLRAAAELNLRGLILSSMHPSLIPQAMQARYPIVALDGIGSQPMNSAAFRLLSTNAKRETAVNAEVFDRYGGARPEVIIPLPVASDPPPARDVETFAPGQQVRLRAAPHAGEIATLVQIQPGLTTLPSGLRAPAALVRTEGGEQTFVPLVNLEVVG
ncbi:MAG: hypothetical protein ACOYZ8_16910 [Chloroflexota bacterium]